MTSFYFFNDFFMISVLEKCIKLLAKMWDLESSKHLKSILSGERTFLVKGDKRYIFPNFGHFFNKIRRGPKLEGSAFANFGYSSETERKSRFEMGNSCGVSLKTGLVPVPPYWGEARFDHFRLSSGVSVLSSGFSMSVVGHIRSLPAKFRYLNVKERSYPGTSG